MQAAGVVNVHADENVGLDGGWCRHEGKCPPRLWPGIGIRRLARSQFGDDDPRGSFDGQNDLKQDKGKLG